MWLRSGMLWLWYRPAAAAPVQPLAGKLPYVAGASIKRKKKKKRKERKNSEMELQSKEHRNCQLWSPTGHAAP